MASINSVQKLFEEQIKDLYSAEKQLTKAIPKMAAAAKDADLKAGLKAHLDETTQQVARLEKIAGLLNSKASGSLCKGMEGVIAEGAEALSTEAPAPLHDLGIIAAARRVEHYEMAGYMTAISLAEELGLSEVIQLLKETLSEEEDADASLEALMPRLVTESNEAPGETPAKSPAKVTAKESGRRAVPAA